MSQPEEFQLKTPDSVASDAEAATHTVTVNGRTTTAFTYDDARHAVVLDDPPGAGAEVGVRYVAGCR